MMNIQSLSQSAHSTPPATPTEHVSMGKRLLGGALALLILAGGVTAPRPPSRSLRITIPVEDPNFIPLPDTWPIQPPPAPVSAAPCLPYAPIETLPPTVQPYTEGVTLEPEEPTGFTTLPKNMHGFILNGIGLVGNGDRGCNISNLQDYYLCRADADYVHDALWKDEELKPQVFNEEALRNVGCVVKRQSDDGLSHRFVHLSIDPKRAANAKNAISLLEEELLSDKDFFERSHEEIEGFIQSLHYALNIGLLGDLPTADVYLKPGKYRTNQITLPKKEFGGKKEDEIAALLRAKGLSQDDVRLWKSSLQKYTFTALEPTEAERNVWKHVGHLFPHSSRVPERMTSFIKDFKAAANAGTHPVALAAWVHCEIGRIHPFGDGNGRLARLLMNGILARGGYAPVIIPNDDVYTEAIENDTDHPGAFTSYLSNLIETQRAGPTLLIRA